MPSAAGTVALMGSGELTSTMVEVHKFLLSRLGKTPSAAFIDTPAGFQLNVDQISQTAVAYFERHVGQRLDIASLKAVAGIDPMQTEAAYDTLRASDYLMVGPGSPTYALGQWQQSRIPFLFQEKINAGGCLTAASAAALTIGRHTLPVYEIYKVGQPPHWVDGLDLLADEGLALVVIPHWNNAEGGNHDTRRCFMGQERFARLKQLLPPELVVLGLDEHTACILDFSTQQAMVRGVGRIIVQQAHGQFVYTSGDTFAMDVLRGAVDKGHPVSGDDTASTPRPKRPETSGTFLGQVEEIYRQLRHQLDNHQTEAATGLLLDLDDAVWMAREGMEQGRTIAQARDLLRDAMAAFGRRLAEVPPSTEACLSPLVEALLNLRDRLRGQKHYPAADAIREVLQQVGIAIDDTPAGSRWHRQR
jgi:peptidase E